MPIRMLMAAAVGALLVVACGPSSTTIAPPAPPTVTPSTQAVPTQPSSPPTAAARPTQPTATAANAETSATPATRVSNDAITLALDPASSQARYHAHEQLVGRSLPSEAVGTSTAVSGMVVLGADGSVKSDQSQIEVDLRQLKSDESRRDNFIKGDTLQTNKFPTATFVPRQVQGLASPLPSTGQASFQLLGDLTVHGVTRPVTWQVSAAFSDATVTGNATTNVNITDFGMTPPKAGPVLSIEDGLTLELVFTANRQA